MSFSFTAKIFGTLGLLLTRTAQAQFDGYQEVSHNQRGLCTFDFDNPNGYFAYNGVAESDWTGDGVGSGADDHPFVVLCDFQFVGQANRVTQTVTYRNTKIVPTIVVPFTNAPVTNIVPGSPAECTVFPGTDRPFSIEETYALVPATSIAPFVTLTTVIVPTSAITTTSRFTFCINIT
jgi:hypothetical protein